VSRLIHEQLGVADARVQASDGGRRGLCVDQSLPESARLAAPAVEQALSSFLFETKVSIG